jgi:hypothetical protein
VPFLLKWGRIGKIFIKVPIWDMFTSPVQVEVENVVALVTRRGIDSWNEETQKEAFKQAQ